MLTTIKETSEYKIVYHEFNEHSETIIVSFDHIWSDIRDAGFGTDLCRNLGVNNIYVSQKAGSQYQGLSLEDFKDAVFPYCSNRKVYSYGSSLGGYAAIYFGGTINAKIISVAPINHAHPCISSHDFKNLEYKHLEINCSPKSNLSPIVLFDPHQHNDLKFIHSTIIPAYPDAAYISYPFSGHTILETMKENGVLSNFIKRLIVDNVIENIYLQKEGCAIYHAELGRKHRYDENYTEAEIELKKSISISPNENAFGHLLWVYIATLNISGLMGSLSQILLLDDPKKIDKWIPIHTRNRLKSMGVDVNEILRIKDLRRIKDQA